MVTSQVQVSVKPQIVLSVNGITRLQLDSCEVLLCALLRAGLEMMQYAAVYLDKDPERRCFPDDSVNSLYQRHVVPPYLAGVWLAGLLAAW